MECCIGAEGELVGDLHCTSLFRPNTLVPKAAELMEPSTTWRPCGVSSLRVPLLCSTSLGKRLLHMTAVPFLTSIDRLVRSSGRQPPKIDPSLLSFANPEDWHTAHQRNQGKQPPRLTNHSPLDPITVPAPCKYRSKSAGRGLH